MKKKIISFFAILMLLFTNYAFAFERITDENATKLKTIAEIISNNTKINGEYNAVTELESDDFTKTENEYYTSNIGDKVYVTKPTSTNRTMGIEDIDDGNDEQTYTNRFFYIELNDGDSTLSFSDNFKVTYYNGLTYNNQKYNVVMKVNSITRNNQNGTQRVYFKLGRWKKSDNSRQIYYPAVGAQTGEGQVEVNTDILVQDSLGNNVDVKGILKLYDIDLQQGIAINNIDATKFTNKNNPRIYMKNEPTDTLYYSTDTQNRSLYVYTSTDQNIKDGITDVCLKMDSTSSVNTTFTFDSIQAFADVGYVNFNNNYYSVTTSVINGTITPSEEFVEKGTDKKIDYSPKDDTYYLKSIKIDGVNVDLSDSIASSYTFTNIQANHSIQVEYAKKYKVEFNTKGGTPANIDTQYVIPRKKATEPAQPTKNGYTFKGWYTSETYQTPYDFNTPVNEDKILYAKWEEVIPEEVNHNIRYQIIGTPKDNNVTNNPVKYTEGTTTPLRIYSPTLEGYTFSGWFEDVDLQGSAISTLDVSSRTDDITLYGKWIKNEEEDVNYTVNHYLEDTNGTITHNNKKYKLDTESTTTKTAKVDTVVTENSKTYTGFKPEKLTLSGTVLEDGSLTLDFYYDKIQYLVEFDSKGGTEVENQTKNYGEKVVEPTDPTKDGYKFLYWYEEVDGKKVIYDFDKPVTSNKKLIAEWEKIKIIPDNTEETNKEIPAQSTDTTVAKKIIPNTGATSILFISLAIVIIGAIFGIRYFKIKNDL